MPTIADQASAIVIATPTIMDGLVVRWFRSLIAAQNHQVSISASRSRVSVHDDEFQTLPRAWLTQAMNVHHQLARDPRADVNDIVTHQRKFGGQLVPVR